MRQLDFDDITALVGRNDIGKSTVLEALDLFFNETKPDEDDLNVDVSEASQIAEIECDFSDLPEKLILDATAETSLAAEYLLRTTGVLTVRKTITFALKTPKITTQVLALHPVNHGYHDLLSLTNTALKSRLKELHPGVAADNASINASLRSAIWAAGGDLEFAEVPIDVSKEDAKKVWDRLGPSLPMYWLFRADRPSQDSDPEVQDPVKLVVRRTLEEEAVREALEKAQQLIEASLVELARRTEIALEAISLELAAALRPALKTPPKWESALNYRFDDERGVPMSKRGSGVRRLILLGFFRAEADRQRTGTERSVIYAIEEPETSQHPTHQRLLLGALRGMAAQQGQQVIVTTHSPELCSLLPSASLRLLTRGNDQAVTVVAPSEGLDEIAQDLGVLPRLSVRALVCVEGPHDVENLVGLSLALRAGGENVVDLAADVRVAVIPMGGGTLRQWVDRRYLQALGAREVHIYDRDPDEKYASEVAAVNARGDGSFATLTQRVELENYAPAGVASRALGVAVEYGESDSAVKAVVVATGCGASRAKRDFVELVFPAVTLDDIRNDGALEEIQMWFSKIAEAIGE